MRRGLKQRKEQTWQAMPRRRRRRLPDEKGIETNWARLPRLAGYSGGAASPMRRGLRHVATTSPRRGTLGHRRRRLPDEKGIETSVGREAGTLEPCRRRRLPDEKGIETPWHEQWPRSGMGC